MTKKNLQLVALYSHPGGRDHYPGVADALQRRGIACEHRPLDPTPIPFQKAQVVVVPEIGSKRVLAVLRAARCAGATTVLLMDGLVEWRNTFVNPRVAPDFLRPAPADLIACAGHTDQRTLEALGNNARATGLPRIAADFPSPLQLSEKQTIMVATARTPAFNGDERDRLLRALENVKRALDRTCARALWRLTGNLETDLGLPNNTDPLSQALLECSAVVTTPSTLLAESMLAGRPTALLHPFGSPCWQRAAWQSGGADVGELEVMLKSLLAPTEQDLARQHEALADLHFWGNSPAENLADLLAQLCRDPVRAPHPDTRFDPVRLPERIEIQDTCARPRAVLCLGCDSSPAGGVTTLAHRLTTRFARGDLGYDVRTLVVLFHPHPWQVRDHEIFRDPRVSVCSIDPCADHWRCIETVRAALERLSPDIVLPSQLDLCFAAATALRAANPRVRMITSLRADESYAKRMMTEYPAWDGALGVSERCARWLKGIAGDRPVSVINSGAPVRAEPRRIAPDGPLRLAWVNRMERVQKRVFDLLTLIDELDARGVEYTLDVVGDGPESGAWVDALRSRRLRSGRVVAHGRRSAAWVRGLLERTDVSVLLSAYEGTSNSMMEAMGVGVVPAVTRVSGAEDWVVDGENGIVVEVGDVRGMAERLAELARDRGRIAGLGRRAWETAQRGFDFEITARRYRELFDAVRARPRREVRTASHLRLIDHDRWRKEWAEQPRAGMEWVMDQLRASGHGSVAVGRPGEGDDAVVIPGDAPPPSGEELSSWRGRGVSVVHFPHLLDSAVSLRLLRAVADAARRGRERIAVYGAGQHTRRGAAAFSRDPPVVGFIDDNPPASGGLFGLPVVRLGEAAERLRPDAVVLSSDSMEGALWERSRGLRERGVEVIALYGSYERAFAPAGRGEEDNTQGTEITEERGDNRILFTH